MSLARDFARRLNPAVLAAEMGLDLDPWQERVVVSEHKRTLVNCSRQSGKSTIGALKALHRAVYFPRSLVLIFSPSLRQSCELLDKCLVAYHAAGKPVVAEAENQRSLILENRSRIIALPGSAATVRGYSGVSLIVIDESAQVKDELLAAVSPMLAVSQGDLMALSTPYGKRGWWWDAWANGGDGWMRVTATADECPRIAKEYLREQRLSLGQRRFEQEFMCKFTEIVDQAFNPEQVSAAFSRDIEPIHFGDMPEA